MPYRIIRHTTYTHHTRDGSVTSGKLIALVNDEVKSLLPRLVNPAFEVLDTLRLSSARAAQSWS